jgi:hypothetical protein
MQTGATMRATALAALAAAASGHGAITFPRSRNAADGALRDRSHCRFVPPLIHFTPDSLTNSVPLFLKRQCDRTLGALEPWKSWSWKPGQVRKVNFSLLFPSCIPTELHVPTYIFWANLTPLSLQARVR